MKISRRFSGGCQCAAVRFHIEGMLGKAEICHCLMCQKAFGNWGAALASVPLGMFAWTRGQPQGFRSSKIVARGYCEKCGTPLYMREDSDTNIELAIGSFDEPNRVGPLVSQAGVESCLTWFNDMHKLTEFRTSDYRTPEAMEKLKSLQHPFHDR